jgi:ParB family chromosome partitioning protein
MPVIVREMTDDEAIIAMVSANRQREEILPSEKAAAYKMWMDAIKRQGQRTDLSYAPVVHKSDAKTSRDIIAQETGESHEQVRRYIRLNELIPEIKDMVDNTVTGDKTKPAIAFRPAVELSYLSKEQQKDLLLTMESEERTPSLSQAMQMKQLSTEGRLDMDATFTIMREDKPNQVEQFRFPKDRIRQFIPKDYDDKKIEDVIVKLLEQWYRKRERERDDAR